MTQLNPVLAAAIGSFLRHVFTIGAGYLVSRGIWTEQEMTDYVAAAALAVVSLGWSLYQKFRAHARIEEALGLPQGSTLDDLKK